MSVLLMANITFSVDGETTLKVGTEEIACFGNVIHGTSDLASYSESRRTWTPVTLCNSKAPGRNGSTRANRPVLMTTRRANFAFNRTSAQLAWALGQIRLR